MSKFAIQYQSLGHRIDIGRLNKAQTQFLGDKEEHTLPALWAAGLFVLVEGGELEVTNDHGKTIRIIAEEVTPPKKDE